MQPAPAVTELAEKMTEVSVEVVADKKTQEEKKPVRSDSPPGAQVEAVTQPMQAPASKPETAKEEGPQDLRVFELNSDSGKSTPSNNGKKGTND